MDIYAASFPGCPGLGAKHMRGLISYFHTAEDVWKASDEEIENSRLITGKRKSAFLAWRRETDPVAVAEKLYTAGIRCCTWEQDEYPALLRTTSNPPAVLFYKGCLPDHEKLVSIVGSRKCTSYGLQTAERFGKKLAERGVVIISGGARGIDSAAHTGALSGKGITVVIAACGLDRVYPPENRQLFDRIVENGGVLISEYPPGTPPLGRQFPARNRIIAGMSRGVLVVEAAERSGSLITADFALEEGRDVFAVPGSIYYPSCMGTNLLIRHGAICCTSFKDVLSEYGWCPEEGEKKTSFRQPMTVEEEMVYQYCTLGEEVSSEDILQQSGFSVARLTMVLLSLQLKGYIREVGTGRYMVMAD